MWITENEYYLDSAIKSSACSVSASKSDGSIRKLDWIKLHGNDVSMIIKNYDQVSLRHFLKAISRFEACQTFSVSLDEVYQEAVRIKEEENADKN